jgi:hypothetical protein
MQQCGKRRRRRRRRGMLAELQTTTTTTRKMGSWRSPLDLQGKETERDDDLVVAGQC